MGLTLRIELGTEILGVVSPCSIYIYYYYYYIYRGSVPAFWVFREVSAKKVFFEKGDFALGKQEE
jgi:hypothetical protein